MTERSRHERLIGESWAPEEIVQGSQNRREAYDANWLKSAGLTFEQVDFEDCGMMTSSFPDPKPHWVTRFYRKETES